MVACFWPATGFLLDSSNKNNSSELAYNKNTATPQHVRQKEYGEGKKREKFCELSIITSTSIFHRYLPSVTWKRGWKQ